MSKRTRGPPCATKGIDPTAIKGQGILYSKVVDALEGRAENGKVRFPEINHLFSWLFHLNKKEIRSLLKELEEEGYIRIVPFHGIELIGGRESAE